MKIFLNIVGKVLCTVVIYALYLLMKYQYMNDENYDVFIDFMQFMCLFYIMAHISINKLKSDK